MYDSARDAWADRDSDAAWPRRNNHYHQEDSITAQKTQADLPVHAVDEQVSSVVLYHCCRYFAFVLCWWSRWPVGSLCAKVNSAMALLQRNISH